MVAGQRDEIDEVMFNLQSLLNQLITLSDEAERVITFHRTLLQWELKADNLRTAYGFAKSIVWKTIEHDFYLYVYSQLSAWLRSTYESANGANIKPQLQQLKRNLNSVLHTCVGLELKSIIPHYRGLLNECQGYENGLSSINFDETTIETQTLQLLEQAAAEFGQDIRLYERLNELSQIGSLEQITSSTSAAVAGSAQTKPSQAFSGPVKSSAKVGAGLETVPFPAPMTSQATEFPNFPGTISIDFTSDSTPIGSVAPPVTTATKPTAPTARLAGPIDPGNYQSFRPYGGPSDLPTGTTTPYSNLAMSVGQPLGFETGEKSAPVPPSQESAATPSLSTELSESESRTQSRPFGFRANVSYFQQRDQASTRLQQRTAQPMVQTKPMSRPKPALQPSLPTLEQLFSPNSDARYQPYEAPPRSKVPAAISLEPENNISALVQTPSDASGFFKQVESRAQSNGDKSQQLTKVESDPDELARVDTFEENVSISTTEFRKENTDAPRELTSNLQVNTSPTVLIDGQNADSEQITREIEVQLPNSQELKSPIEIEHTDPEIPKKEKLKAASSKITSERKMKRSHKKGRNNTQPPRSKERKFSYVFQSGNEQVHMSSASSPFQEKLFTAEESVDYSSDRAEPKDIFQFRSISSDSSSLSTSSSSIQLIGTRKPDESSRPHGRSRPMYLVPDQKRPSSRKQPQFTIVMKSFGLEGEPAVKSRSSSSSSSGSISSSSSGSGSSGSSSSGSSSGRGRTMNVKNSRSPSSSSRSTSSSSSRAQSAGQKRVSSRSPITVFKIKPLEYEIKLKKKSRKVGSRRRRRSAPPPQHRLSSPHRSQGQSTRPRHYGPPPPPPPHHHHPPRRSQSPGPERKRHSPPPPPHHRHHPPRRSQSPGPERKRHSPPPPPHHRHHPPRRSQSPGPERKRHSPPPPPHHRHHPPRRSQSPGPERKRHSPPPPPPHHHHHHHHPPRRSRSPGPERKRHSPPPPHHHHSPRRSVSSGAGRRQSSPLQQPYHHHHHHHHHHHEFAHRQQQQMHQVSPLEKSATEFETCSHIESGEVTNKNGCQSSIVIRHVCKKCQKNLDSGNALVRRNSVASSPDRRNRSNSREAFQRGIRDSGEGQLYLGDGEIYANRAFMKCYELNHRSVSAGKNKKEPKFIVRSLSDLRGGLY